MFTLDEAQVEGTPKAKKPSGAKRAPKAPVPDLSGVVIKVVGVGGAGGNAVTKMAGARVPGVTYINVNTDLAALNASECDVRIQIGENTTCGKGAGSVPEVGRKSAEESRKVVAEVFEDSDLVFITAGMGGGTGTGAAPTIAEIAHECGALTVAVVTRPFKFEGNRKALIAQQGIDELLGKVDTLIIIPNEKLREVTPQKITLANAFAIADGVLQQAVSGIADMLSHTGFINLDFADLRAILKDAGYAHMGVGESTGKSKVEDAATAAVESPLMVTSIRGAQRILIRVTGSPDITMEDVELVVGSVQESAHPDANIIFGVDFDETLTDALKVVVIATDFDDSRQWDTASPIIRHEPSATAVPAAPAAPAKSAQRESNQHSAPGGNRVVRSDMELPKLERRSTNLSDYNRNLGVDIPYDDPDDEPDAEVGDDLDDTKSGKSDWGDLFSMLK
ncbi:MAG: cell division protein FtsZ [Oscillospiraceae bacterium]|nr:cell division protein FtsZ [Oscillospiraceae bacterium]